MHCPARKQELQASYRRVVDGLPRQEVPLTAVVGLVVSHAADGGDLEFLLTLRSGGEISHPHQVCLPGGGLETHEHNQPLRALDRECFEEVGLPEGLIEWESQPWDAMPSRHGHVVAPYLGFVDRARLPSELRRDEREVAAAAWLPLASLFDGAFWDDRGFVVVASRPGEPSRHVRSPIWSGWTPTTWGLTAYFLGNFVRRISGRHPLEGRIPAPL